MTDADRIAAIKAAGITDDQLLAIAEGKIVMWRDEGVRKDERAACQEIAARYGGSDAEAIAELIGQRNFKR